MAVRRFPRLRTFVPTTLVAVAPAWLKGRSRSSVAEEHQAALNKLDIEERKLDLKIRRIALFWLCVFLAIAAILIAITVWCYLEGSHETIPLVTGPLGIISGLLSALLGRKARDPPRPLEEGGVS